MKVALVIERLDPSRGGRETSTAQIAEGLARRGCQVTVLCQQGRWDAPGVAIEALGTRGLTRCARLANFAHDVQLAMAGGRFDVVHATLPIPGVDVYQPRGGTVPAQLVASLRRRSMIGRAIRRLAEPLNLTRRQMGDLESQVMADGRTWRLAVSQMVAEEFTQYYGPSGRQRVVYNAVDVPAVSDEQRADWRQELRFRLGVGQADAVFVTAATNFALKGVQEAIEAFADWAGRSQAGRSARLVVIGRTHVEGWRRLANQLDVGTQVVFVPPTREMFQYYSAADAVLLLSWYDPCSRVILEALRWGLPGITTAYNGASEMLQRGAGIVVQSPRDRRALVDAYERLGDAASRHPFAQACRAIGDWLGMDRHVTELLEVYNEVLSRK